MGSKVYTLCVGIPVAVTVLLYLHIAADEDPKCLFQRSGFRRSGAFVKEWALCEKVDEGMVFSSPGQHALCAGEENEGGRKQVYCGLEMEQWAKRRCCAKPDKCSFVFVFSPLLLCYTRRTRERDCAFWTRPLDASSHGVKLGF
ncbi:hypothetical protein F5Y15DRAFT_215386 [Xylariaceae sp. FL0016]|nr:hypothetical protein F5Y15DRAFT_215386 [Xylariaceae sp. FL0016]